MRMVLKPSSWMRQAMVAKLSVSAVGPCSGRVECQKGQRMHAADCLVRTASTTATSNKDRAHASQPGADVATCCLAMHDGIPCVREAPQP